MMELLDPWIEDARSLLRILSGDVRLDQIELNSFST